MENKYLYINLKAKRLNIDKELGYFLLFPDDCPLLTNYFFGRLCSRTIFERLWLEQKMKILGYLWIISFLFNTLFFVIIWLLSMAKDELPNLRRKFDDNGHFFYRIFFSFSLLFNFLYNYAWLRIRIEIEKTKQIRIFSYMFL